MEDQLKQFSQAVLQGLTSGDRNAGTDSAAVNQYAQGAFGDILAKAGDGVGTLANTVAEKQRQEAEAARQKEMNEIQQKLDPSNYKVVRKEDGGYDFFDSTGKPITIDRYAAVTGLRPVDILAKSENPLDIQYVQDYNNTRDVVEAINNGDQATISTFLKSNQQIDPKSTAADIMKALAEKYPHIYGKAGYDDTYAKSWNNPLIRPGGSGVVSSGGGGGGWMPS